MLSSSSVSVERVDLSRIDAKEWDAEAIRRGASMRSAFAHLKRVGLKHLWIGRPRIYEIRLGKDDRQVRIGHYTLVRRGKVAAFYDGLNLFSEHRNLWPQAMRAALTEAGPGDFEYGWQWSLEPPRDMELKAIAGVTVTSSRQILVQGVDFANWEDWDAYHRDISENIRRNAKKAERLHPDLAIVVIKGFAAVAHLPTLVAMRDALYRRKGLPFSPLRVLASHALSYVACPTQAMIALAIGSGRVLAIQNMIEFGDAHYNLDGAAANGPRGGAWHLQIAMLKRAYDRSPKGKYLLGYTDVPVVNQSAQGLLRSRRSLRATDWPTSLIQFRWAPRTSKPCEALHSEPMPSTAT